MFTENDVSYSDDQFSFTDVTIEPKPVGGRVPFWYCGGTPRSARLAVEFCDGWMPGRIGMDTLAKRIADIDQRSADAGRTRPTIAVIPPTSIEATREEALKHVNIPGLLAWANKAKFAVKPPSGSFDTVDDLTGQLIVGDPDQAVEEIGKFAALGVEHLVFDFRFKFDEWYDQIELLGGEVLPEAPRLTRCSPTASAGEVLRPRPLPEHSVEVIHGLGIVPPRGGRRSDRQTDLAGADRGADTLVDWIGIIDELDQQAYLERYSAVLMDRIGPFKLRADLDISVSDVVEGERLRVRASGEDRQVSSRIEIDVVLTVSENGGGPVTVVVDGSYQVTGKVATMGSGMIRQKATKVLDEFVDRAGDPARERSDAAVLPARARSTETVRGARADRRGPGSYLGWHRVAAGDAGRPPATATSWWTSSASPGSGGSPSMARNW